MALALPLAATAEETVEALDSIVISGAKGDSGFVAKRADIGPLGERPILDTPYSISVITAELIKNQQATSLADLLKYLPSTQMQARGGMDVGRPQSRGMQSSVVENNHLDGLNVVGTTAYPMEQLERVEVINSLTGALYGPASPGGNFNFINKRPTDTPLRDISVGYSGRGATAVHADIGGRIGQTGAIGYRINFLNDEGTGEIAGSKIHRKFFSAALDFHLSDNTVLELNASHYEFTKLGYPGGFGYAANVQLPAAVDPTVRGYGQAFAGMDLTTDTSSARIKHRFNDQWNLTAAIGHQVADRDMYSPSNTLNGNGTFISKISYGVPGRFVVNSNAVNLNGTLQTGSWTHEIVLGTTGYSWDINSALNSSTSYTLGTSPLDNPVVFTEPNLQRSGGRYRSGDTVQQTAIFGDTITFNPQWSAMLVGSFSKITSRGFNKSGTLTDRIKTDGFSPTVALMYKPRQDVTTYVAYADSLQAGDAAPTGTLNEGEVLSAYRSQQWEVGAKFDMFGLQGGAALFNLERPFAYTGVDDVFRNQGNQRNKGLELSLSGAVTPRLSIYSGITLLDAKLLDTQSAATSNKRVVGVPKVQASLLAEYSLPQASGLVVTGNVHYTGRRAGNDTNTTYAAGYTTLDLGLRYTTKAFGQSTVWRLAVNNVTDKKYWASIFPGSVNGSNSAANAFLGSSRELRASVTIAL